MTPSSKSKRACTELDAELDAELDTELKGRLSEIKLRAFVFEEAGRSESGCGSGGGSDPAVESNDADGNDGSTDGSTDCSTDGSTEELTNGSAEELIAGSTEGTICSPCPFSR